MNRRNLLRTTALALPVAFLAACGATPGTTPVTTPPAPTVNVVANDISLVSQGVSSMLVSLEAAPNLDPVKLQQLEGYVTQLRAAANAIAEATVTPAASAVQEIVKIVQALAPIALSLIPGGSTLTALVQAALSMLPIVLSAVGVVGAGGPAPVYNAEQARLILAGARR
jgi:hypothetical protein